MGDEKGGQTNTMSQTQLMNFIITAQHVHTKGTAKTGWKTKRKTKEGVDHSKGNFKKH